MKLIHSRYVLGMQFVLGMRLSPAAAAGAAAEAHRTFLSGRCGGGAQNDSR